MANYGKLANVSIIPGAVTTLYQVPRGPGIIKNYAMVSINVCNRGNQAAATSIALCEDGVYTPTGANWIEYNTEVLAHGVLERTAILLSEGQSIHVNGSDSNLSAVVFGVLTGTLSEDNLLVNGELTDSADNWQLFAATWNAAGTVTLDDGGAGTSSYLNQNTVATLQEGTYAWEINLKAWNGDAVQSNNRVNYAFSSNGTIYSQGRFTRAGIHSGEFEVLNGDANIGNTILVDITAQFLGTAEVDYVRLYKVA